MIQSINKQQMVCKHLARRLLVMQQEGVTRLPAIKQLAADYGVGIGTVQGALRELKESGAVELNACGASGSFIAASNRRKLFDACGYGELICLMPMNNTPVFRGLATAIYEAVSGNGIPIHILFARGSRNRINIVRRQMGHFAVMSELAYETALRCGKTDIEMVCSVGSYAEEIGCMTRDGFDFDLSATPVAYDDHSYDQLAIHSLLGLKPDTGGDYLDVQLADLVRSGSVAAALAMKSALQPDSGLRYHTLEGIPEDVKAKLSRAVIVVRRGEPSLNRLLASAMQPETVAAVQNAVLCGSKPVKY